MKDVTIRISQLPEIGKQFKHTTDSFQRRVNENYIIPKVKDDPFIEKEGLYSCSVVPRYHDGHILDIIFRTTIVDINSTIESRLFEEKFKGFEQEVKKRFIIPSKSRTYFNEKEWMGPKHGFEIDGSPEDFYASLIFPEYLIGKVVTVIYNKEKNLD